MIEKGFIHLIGSDSHNTTTRNFCIKDAYDFLNKNFESGLVPFLKLNSEKLINGKIINNLF